MKRGKRTIWVAIYAVLFSTILITPVSAGTSISGTARCRVPYLITLSDGRKVAADSQNSKEESAITKAQENKDAAVLEENKPNLIQQQEEIASEDNTEVKQITTVCAK